jgi:guanylate kinase
MEYRQNEQLKIATEFIQFTNKNIFLTGKAGTGKTTFLHNLRKITPKRMVVVAPTGVAAINAGGVTIHSFFQLSFAPAIPESIQPRSSQSQTEGYKRKFSREKINLIKCIDLLVIDEISMVRADVLDSIDEVLRKYRNRSKPFGGVQLLMIGDLHQLSPVIKETEWNILKNYYNSIYFFDSLALKNSNSVSIELKEIFRQSDEHFIALLNKVRDNKIDQETVDEINSRFITGFKANDNEGFITLTTHNANAYEMNQIKLKEIKSESHFFSADVFGDFPNYNFPTDQDLELKVGAQVMFIKNDSNPGKEYYNGKIGKITNIDEDFVYVKCPHDKYEITVGKVEWENVKYSLNENTKEISEEVVGSFTQIPLKLAWAITIHKSQGLTFEKVIIDANAAFAFGQVYVALSRCRTFEGIVLSTPISISGIKTDSLVIDYSNETRENEPGPEKLFQSKKLFQQDLILELFDFKLLKYRFDDLIKITTENANILDANIISDLQIKRNQFDTELYLVAEKFKHQINQFIQVDFLPEENTELQDRIKKAANYFSENLKIHLVAFIENLHFDTDNKAVKKLLATSLEKIQKEVFVKSSCLTNTLNGFETISYIRKRSDSEVDFRPTSKEKEITPLKVSTSVNYPELYNKLKKWRDNLAEENNYPVYMVLPQKTLVEITNKLPTTSAELKAIKGIGQAKINQFGMNIVTIISEYCESNSISTGQIEIPVKEKKEKGQSKKLSFELYQSGKIIKEIALERGFSVSTIEGHLSQFVASGDLKISEFVSPEKVEAVLEYMNNHPKKTIGEIKNNFGSNLSYIEFGFIVQHINWLKKI